MVLKYKISTMEAVIIIVFVLGYLAITLEHTLKIDKLIPVEAATRNI